MVLPPEGTDLKRDEQVAIKFYLTTLLNWQRQAIRIQREFLIASEIEHPHIARVHDLVLSPNRPLHSFLVMDYVEGVTVSANRHLRGLVNTDLRSELVEPSPR